MKIRWMAAVAALTLLPAAALAQTPEERIDGALARAGEVGIPVSLLESKLAEGRAKGVSMDRIAAAMESRLQGLERAREVMGRGAGDVDAAELSLGADALGAGVSEAALEAIAASTDGDNRGVAVAVLMHLVDQGVVPAEALAAVQDALARGPNALANLPAQAGAAAGAGAPAGTPGAAGSGPPSSLPVPGQAGPPRLPRPGGPPGGGA